MEKGGHASTPEKVLTPLLPAPSCASRALRRGVTRYDVLFDADAATGREEEDAARGPPKVASPRRSSSGGPRSELNTPSPRGVFASVSHISSSEKTTARTLFCARGASPSHRRRGCDFDCCCCCCCCCCCDSISSDCKEPQLWSTTVKESPNRLGSNWGGGRRYPTGWEY